MKLVTEAMISKYLWNITEGGKEQVIYFILAAATPQAQLDAIGFILLQVQDFARMYPEFQNEVMEVPDPKEKE